MDIECTARPQMLLSPMGSIAAGGRDDSDLEANLPREGDLLDAARAGAEDLLTGGLSRLVSESDILRRAARRSSRKPCMAPRRDTKKDQARATCTASVACRSFRKFPVSRPTATRQNFCFATRARAGSTLGASD